MSPACSSKNYYAPANGIQVLGGATKINIETDALERSGKQVQTAKEILEALKKVIEIAIETLLEDWMRITRESAHFRDLKLTQDCIVMPEEPDVVHNARFNSAIDRLREMLNETSALGAELEKAREDAFGAAKEYQHEDNGLVKFLDKFATPFSPWSVIRAWSDDRPLSIWERMGNAALPPESLSREYVARYAANWYGHVGDLFNPNRYDMSPEALIKTKINAPVFKNQEDFIRFAREENLKDEGSIQVYKWKENGKQKFYMYIPGTTDWFPGDNKHPLGASSNVDVMYSGESSGTQFVFAVMTASGIGKGAEGAFGAHSQGGPTAYAVIKKLDEEGDGPKVKSVLTLESPSAHNPLPDGVRSLNVENTRDGVPMLDGSMNETDLNSMTIIGTAPDEGRHDPLASADIIESARCDPTAAQQLEAMDQDLPPAGVEVEAFSYQVDQSADWNGQYTDEFLDLKNWLKASTPYNVVESFVETIK